MTKAAESVGLSQDQIAAGLNKVLSKGAQPAVENLGKPDGFLKNVDVKIPMPKHLDMVEKGLRAIGQDAKADQFVDGIIGLRSVPFLKRRAFLGMRSARCPLKTPKDY